MFVESFAPLQTQDALHNNFRWQRRTNEFDVLTTMAVYYMIFTYMCKTCGCAFRSRDFGNVERFIEPCILLLLSKDSSHGYGLMEDLEKHCGEKVDIGDLYRTLRRMERDCWVKSDWEKNEGGPDRRTYTITPEGKDFLESAATSLTRTDKLIHKFLDGFKKSQSV